MLGERSPDGIDVTSWGAQQEETVRITSITIGLETAKSVFQVHVEDVDSRTVTRRRLRRSQVAAFLARQTARVVGIEARGRSEEHTSELQSLLRISYDVCCLNKKTTARRIMSHILMTQLLL